MEACSLATIPETVTERVDTLLTLRFSPEKVLMTLIREGFDFTESHKAITDWHDRRYERHHLPCVIDIELAVLYYLDGLDRLELVKKFRFESGPELMHFATTVFIANIAEVLLIARYDAEVCATDYTFLN